MFYLGKTKRFKTTDKFELNDCQCYIFYAYSMKNTRIKIGTSSYSIILYSYLSLLI